MFLVLLRFFDNKDTAGQHAEGHKAWIRQGLDDGVFLLVGSIQPGIGGAILAHNTSAADLEVRLLADPFVAEGIVRSEIIEIRPVMADNRLRFLVETASGSPSNVARRT